MFVVIRRDPLPEIERLYRHELERFVRVARAIVGDDEAARDAVQEAFTRAVEKRGSFRRRGPVEAWLWRIVVNESRKRAGRVDVRLRAEEAVASQNGDAHDGEVRAAVAALPERQRLAVFLRHYADLDYDAIAAALGVKRGTVSATLSAAHRNLSETLKEQVHEHA
jgi:RNA polymerase sigma-70 factor, ECF subfamily